MYTHAKDKSLSFFHNDGKTPLPDVNVEGETRLITPCPETPLFQRSLVSHALDDHYDDHDHDDDDSSRIEA